MSEDMDDIRRKVNERSSVDIASATNAGIWGARTVCVEPKV